MPMCVVERIKSGGKWQESQFDSIPYENSPCLGLAPSVKTVHSLDLCHF